MIMECVICSTPNPKYKCPNCRKPSCSVRCSKAHKDGCTQVPGPATAALATRSIDGDAVKPVHAPNIADLEELFARYPALRKQLRDIYNRTQHCSVRENAGRDRGENGSHNANHLRTPWRPEKAFDDGLKAFKSALDQDHDNAAGLQAFLSFVEHRSLHA